jgi:hypothetical protein
VSKTTHDFQSCATGTSLILCLSVDRTASYNAQYVVSKVTMNVEILKWREMG